MATNLLEPELDDPQRDEESIHPSCAAGSGLHRSSAASEHRYYIPTMAITAAAHVCIHCAHLSISRYTYPTKISPFFCVCFFHPALAVKWTCSVVGSLVVDDVRSACKPVC